MGRPSPPSTVEVVRNPFPVARRLPGQVATIIVISSLALAFGQGALDLARVIADALGSP